MDTRRLEEAELDCRCRKFKKNLKLAKALTYDESFWRLILELEPEPLSACTSNAVGDIGSRCNENVVKD
jgi:hypothetical protein